MLPYFATVQYSTWPRARSKGTELQQAARGRRTKWRPLCLFSTYRCDHSINKAELLSTLIKIAAMHRYVVQVDDGWRRFDFKISHGRWCHAFVLAAVVHDDNEQDLLRIRCKLYFSSSIWRFLSVDAALIAIGILTKPSHALIAAACGSAVLVIAICQMLAFGRTVQMIIATAARQSALTNCQGT
jgi:hypothetical protein